MQTNRIHHFYHRVRRQLLSHVYLARFLVLLLMVSLFIGSWYLLRPHAGKILSGLELVAGKPLPETNGRTNILILGSGGPGHDGPNLSDTIILASIKVDTGETTLISIPRDYWIPSIEDKINAAYQYGYEKQATSGGLQQAKSAVSEAVGLYPHFAMNIDFSTFSQAVDLLGGIDITVDRTFDDYEYPIAGRENDLCGGDPETKCRYEHLHFSAGFQHMDGETALKFVRSRHSTDLDEGTDFARSRRQEKVITAVKNKILSVNNLTNTKLYKQLFDLAVSSVFTDISPDYYSTLVRLALKARQIPLKTYALTSPDQLENPPLSDKYDGKWVLIPKGGDQRSVYNYITSLLP
jgi:polyisoprenyl-teichoic acid--peptidoglycan teichoic acid transferase